MSNKKFSIQKYKLFLQYKKKNSLKIKNLDRLRPMFGNFCEKYDIEEPDYATANHSSLTIFIKDDVSVGTIIRLAKENNTALEINRDNLNDPVYRDFLLRIRDEKLLWSIGSDAHTADVTIAAAERTRMLENLGFSEEQHWRIDK